MALTRITQSVIKDTTITEGKFANAYLNADQTDIAQQAITFQSNVTFRRGSSGTNYLVADFNTGTITLDAGVGNSGVNVLNISNGSIAVSGNVNVTNGSVNAERVKIDDGSSLLPSLVFSDSPNEQTGFYRVSIPNDTIEVAIAGAKTLGISTQVISLGSNRVDILTQSGNYTEVLGYSTGDSSTTVGGLNSKLRLKVANSNVINIRSVNSTDNAYPNNEKRVGINVDDPTATLDVGGSIKATSYVGIESDDPPSSSYN